MQTNYNTTQNNLKKLTLTQMNCHTQNNHSKAKSNQQTTVRSVHMCVCIALCTLAHNTAQNRPDNFPSYPPNNHHCSHDVDSREVREGGQTKDSHQMDLILTWSINSKGKARHTFILALWWTTNYLNCPVACLWQHYHNQSFISNNNNLSK